MSDDRSDDLIPRPDPVVAPQDLIRARQRARATILAVLLGLFVILVFAISIVKMTPGAGQ